MLYISAPNAHCGGRQQLMRAVDAERAEHAGELAEHGHSKLMGGDRAKGAQELASMPARTWSCCSPASPRRRGIRAGKNLVGVIDIGGSGSGDNVRGGEREETFFTSSGVPQQRNEVQAFQPKT